MKKPKAPKAPTAPTHAIDYSIGFRPLTPEDRKRIAMKLAKRRGGVS